ncbi:hypothetical protein Sgleb_58420 [Streptomyces glebosus]|uniref:Uncharacterized protein n=1 Tax=Streptomyces glebosus TaxID=249580 RepID=A0A640T815_9ACTN|nr:hypothetical protein Sgleb_58420 [Streptomyces glebosus]GHG84239.1 hypothetical protein GCM10010513_64290 [Streptomyces glebosus]
MAVFMGGVFLTWWHRAGMTGAEGGDRPRALRGGPVRGDPRGPWRRAGQTDPADRPVLRG